MKRTGCAALAAIIIISIVFTALPGVFSLRADAVSASGIQNEINSILESEMKRAGVKDIQQMLNGFAANPGAYYTFAFSLIQYKGDALSYSKYADSLKKYSNSSPTTRLFLALIFAAMNTNKSFVEDRLKNDVGELGIMSYVYGLHLIANCCEEPKSSGQPYIDKLLSMQITDNETKEKEGWALSGTKSTVDVTAMVVQALAHFRNNADVKKAIDRGLSALSDMQQSDGGFADSGKKNPESAAQVIVALTALGINPLTDSRFIKDGKSPVDAMLAYKLSDGGFTHDDGKYNSMATVQALYSLISIYRMQKGTGALYDIDTNIKLPKDSGGQVYVTTTTTTMPTTRQDNNSVKTGEGTFVLNTHTKKFHSPDCAEVKKIEDQNKKVVKSSREELIAQDYKPCKVCNATATTAPTAQTATQTTAVYSSYSRRTATRPDKSASTDSTEKTKTDTASGAKKEATSKPEKSGTTAQAKTGIIKPTEKTKGTASVTYSESAIEAENTTVFPSVSEYKQESVSQKADKKENNNKPTDDENDKNALPKIKIILISGVWALALAGAAILIIRKNKKAVNYIIIFAVAAAGTAGIFFGDIKTPDEYYKTPAVNSADTVTVTMSITCETVAGEGEESVTPSDGIILPETEFTLDEGSTVYDCLIYAAKKYKIQIEDNTQTLSDHSRAYIAGINYLYEFDYGNLSGWMYSVNGEFADRGCGEYTLNDGDCIKWQYTRNIGDDLK